MHGSGSLPHACICEQSNGAGHVLGAYTCLVGAPVTQLVIRTVWCLQAGGGAVGGAGG
jgi:hypothetical protein